MSLDLEKHLVFYGAYHHDKTNIVIHMCCVPLILFSNFWIAANSPTLIPLPSWLTAPYLQLNLCTLAAFVWGSVYVLLEPVAGTALALLCLAGAAAGNYAFAHYDHYTITTYAVAIQIASWILQFVGHGKFERRAPALLDNLFQAIFLAPLFVWLEMLFSLGYRRELQGRVERDVKKEIAKFQASKKTNGKAQ